MEGVVSSQFTVSENFYQLFGIQPRTLCCASITAVTTCNNVNLVGYPFRICEETVDTVPGPVKNLRAPQDTIGINTFILFWDPPQNYNTIPGVVYNINIDLWSVVLTDITYLYVSDLEPCTEYTVEVIATVNEPSNSSNITVMTKPSLPPPPENVTFSIINPFTNRINLTWNQPSQLECIEDIQLYKVVWNCNELQVAEFNPFTTSIIIEVDESTLGWCTAQLQSCYSEESCGNFSNQASASVPFSRPSEPRCFIFSESNLHVNVTFEFPIPFITSDLNISWTLRNIDYGDLISESYSYIFNPTNRVNLEVNSNTEYVFSLIVCNIYDCSPPCNIEFITSVSFSLLHNNHNYCTFLCRLFLLHHKIYQSLQQMYQHW